MGHKHLGCTPAFTDLASEVFALIVTPLTTPYVALCGLVQMGHWPCVTPPNALQLLLMYLCAAFIVSHTLSQNSIEHLFSMSDRDTVVVISQRQCNSKTLD